MEDDKCYGIKKKMAIRRTILNKVLKVGLTEEVLFEQRLKGVGEWVMLTRSKEYSRQWELPVERLYDRGKPGTFEELQKRPG